MATLHSLSPWYPIISSIGTLRYSLDLTLEHSCDVSLGIVIIFLTKKFSSAPLGPSCLVRDISYHVNFILLYWSFKNYFFTLILTAQTKSIQGYHKAISTPSISIALKYEWNTYLSLVLFKCLRIWTFSPSSYLFWTTTYDHHYPITNHLLHFILNLDWFMSVFLFTLTYKLNWRFQLYRQLSLELGNMIVREIVIFWCSNRVFECINWFKTLKRPWEPILCWPYDNQSHGCFVAKGFTM